MWVADRDVGAAAISSPSARRSTLQTLVDASLLRTGKIPVFVRAVCEWTSWAPRISACPSIKRRRPRKAPFFIFQTDSSEKFITGQNEREETTQDAIVTKSAAFASYEINYLTYITASLKNCLDGQTLDGVFDQCLTRQVCPTSQTYTQSSIAKEFCVFWHPGGVTVTTRPTTPSRPKRVDIFLHVCRFSLHILWQNPFDWAWRQESQKNA